MSHFEFISVALSLVYALAVAEVLRSLAPALRPSVRYWPHFIWLAGLIPIIAFAWWITWNIRGVHWTGPQFFYVLMVAAILYVMSCLLSGRDQRPVDSYRTLFERNRKPFFVLLLLYLSSGALSPWVLGTAPVGELAPVQGSALPAMAVAAVGLFAKSPRALTILGLAAWTLALTALALTPIR